MSAAKAKGAKRKPTGGGKGAGRSAKPRTQEAPKPVFFFLGIVGLVTVAQVLVLSARAGEGRPLMMMDIWPYLFWLVSSAAVAVALKAARWRGSGALLAGIFLLSGLGVVVRSRMSGMSPGVTDMHVLIQPAGFALLFGAWFCFRRGRVELLRPFWGLSLLLMLGLAAGMLVLGARYRGGLYAPGGLTPTEILKLFAVLGLAGFFSRPNADWEGRGVFRPPLGDTFFLLVIWGSLAGMLVLHRDFGLFLLLSATALVMLMCATCRLSWGVAALAAMAGGVWAVLRYFAHGARRFEAFLDPFSDPTGSGWQVLQGLTGMYAGGLMGMGLGAGRPERLPIASSDFVYAVYAEDAGFVGSVLLLILFARIFRSGVRITRRQEEDFARLLGAGLVASLAVQTLVNIGGVVNVLPITGIPLPYISQGGSSYWVTSLHFGLLLALSDRAR
ncbi:MAG: FtsW/RodA/SpoVE family cell cycle protein [Verrucomicrobia bacterium]|nr:FtsW/RodA/SpoVE family cell cycle protein [Verrucomicrobiota bacterium]MCH8525652.1 FtsW/RodA/SpoVE family cell cycle protein [Kiritimatiellia bacterium]